MQYSFSNACRCWGCNIPLMIHVVFVREKPDALAILLLGKMAEVRWIKWSAITKERLCFATKFANKDSAPSNGFLLRDGRKNALKLSLLLLTALAISWCLEVAKCFLASFTPAVYNVNNLCVTRLTAIKIALLYSILFNSRFHSCQNLESHATFLAAGTRESTLTQDSGSSMAHKLRDSGSHSKEDSVVYWTEQHSRYTYCKVLLKHNM